jgi:hypothetical protein
VRPFLCPYPYDSNDHLGLAEFLFNEVLEIDAGRYTLVFQGTAEDLIASNANPPFNKLDELINKRDIV